jgi:acyl-CoA thioester hydrolase
LRLNIPDRKKLVHEMVMPIRWGDMDAMGHVNNTVYFRYFETVRIEWLRTLGGGPNRDGDGIVIVNAFCNFIKQLEYPGDVLVRHYVANPGRTSFETYLGIERTDQPGVLYATGGAKAVWANMREEKAVPLPDWLRKVID